MSNSSKDDGQEKSLPATPARLEKARRDGDVPQSREANAAASYLGFFLAFTLFGGATALAAANQLLPFLKQPEIAASALQGGESNLLIYVLSAGTLILAPFLVLPAVCVLASLVAQRALVFAPSKLKPKMQTISPTSNFKKKFGPEGIVEFLKSLSKLVLVFSFLTALFVIEFPQLPSKSLLPATSLLHDLSYYGVLFLAAIVVFTIIIAAIDLPWTLHQYAKRHRMSLEEMKRETKEDEGDPALKQKRRDRAQQIATNRMLRDVPGATVVVVNPTHFAVALKWDRNTRGAPVCVAKGQDEIALRIKAVAAENGVPIRHDPPTARALFASVEIGEEIKREHYEAVAAVIRFADQIRQKARAK